MKMKQIISLLLSAVMVLGIISGCSNNQPETTDPTQDTTPSQTQELPTQGTKVPETTAPVTSATVLSAEKDAELHADLQARIDEILNTKTEIVHSDTYIPGETYTGTAYYVSNDGDDNNDGLTPETAWQSVSKLLQELDQREGCVLKPGDAIFLRRGDTFRLPDWNLFVSLSGVSISAYGDGEKPIITASSENGSGAEKWELIYEDDSGKKIWKFYKDMRDVSMIVLNDGEAFSTRVYEFFGENGYVSCEDTDWWMHEDNGVTLSDTLLSLEESMTEDLNMISRPAWYKNDDGRVCDFTKGPVYLRCDSGNPGDLYSSIEFTEADRNGIMGLNASDCVLDNISFRSAGYTYIGGAKGIKNIIIQNCEFAYGGGCVDSFESDDMGNHRIIVHGDGIYGVGQNATIDNCYFHDATSTTCTYEAPEAWTDCASGYYHVFDNVMVNTMGVRLDSTFEHWKYMDSVVIRGNQIWNNGAKDRGKYFYSEGSVVLWPNHYGECIIEDNVFYGTENGYESNGLLNVWFYKDRGDTVPQIRNNIYVQHNGGSFGYFDMCRPNHIWEIDDPELLTKAAEYLGDTTSQFYIIE